MLCPPVRKRHYSTVLLTWSSFVHVVSWRSSMKNKELDLLIVVNMFLTGFDATTLNTLWVDKNLKMHGLIQAYSRTNRILNSIKVFGNIVCFRNLQKRTDDAISLFGDKEAGGIVLMRGYKDYYFGYEDVDGKYHPGYQDMIEELTTKFPLTEERITGEQRQKEFIVLFGAILRMRNLLTSFDEFAGSEILSERDFQDYLGRYQDLRDEWKNRKPGGEKEDITDDIVFEIELIKQIEINMAISAQAINQKYTQFKKTPIGDNPAFTFRTFLLRLGLIGPEYKNVRMHLLKNLPGDKAWRHDKSLYPSNQPRLHTDEVR